MGRANLDYVLVVLVAVIRWMIRRIDVNVRFLRVRAYREFVVPVCGMLPVALVGGLDVFVVPVETVSARRTKSADDEPLLVSEVFNIVVIDVLVIYVPIDALGASAPVPA